MHLNIYLRCHIINKCSFNMFYVHSIFHKMKQKLFFSYETETFCQAPHKHRWILHRKHSVKSWQLVLLNRRRSKTKPKEKLSCSFLFSAKATLYADMQFVHLISLFCLIHFQLDMFFVLCIFFIPHLSPSLQHFFISKCFSIIFFWFLFKASPIFFRLIFHIF